MSPHKQSLPKDEVYDLKKGWHFCSEIAIEEKWLSYGSVCGRYHQRKAYWVLYISWVLHMNELCRNWWWNSMFLLHLMKTFSYILSNYLTRRSWIPVRVNYIFNVMSIYCKLNQQRSVWSQVKPAKECLITICNLSYTTVGRLYTHLSQLIV